LFRQFQLKTAKQVVVVDVQHLGIDRGAASLLRRREIFGCCRRFIAVTARGESVSIGAAVSAYATLS